MTRWPTEPLPRDLRAPERPQAPDLELRPPLERGASALRWIIGLNVAVFLLWQLSAQRPGGVVWMAQHFTVSAQGLREGRYWTLASSVFSHYLGVHILLNMLVLYGFGRILAWEWGGRRFLWFYLAAGLAGSVAHVVVSAELIGSGAAALGASGAVSGVLVAFSLRHPEHRVYLFFILPLPALVVALLFIGFDLYGLLQQTRGAGLPIGHGAHLGGAAVAALLYALVPALRQEAPGSLR